MINCFILIKQTTYFVWIKKANLDTEKKAGAERWEWGGGGLNLGVLWY